MLSLKSKLSALLTSTQSLLSKVPHEEHDLVPEEVKMRVAMDLFKTVNSETRVVERTTIEEIFEKVKSGAFKLVEPEDSTIRVQEHLKELRELLPLQIDQHLNVLESASTVSATPKVRYDADGWELNSQ